MRIFECQNCSQALYFENTNCESCGLRLGYLPEMATITALKEDNGTWQALAEPEGRYRHCGNAIHDVCNWLVPADAARAVLRGLPAQPHHPRPVGAGKPAALAQDRSRQASAVLHPAEIRPAARHQGGGSGRRWRSTFFADQTARTVTSPVMTGHEDGLITINLAEADDAERERQRSQMGEPYRTLLGHFRHEIAHYYWDRLVAQSREPRGIPRRLRRRAAGLWRGAAAALCQRPAVGLAGPFRDVLCEFASLGGFRRDLGALLPHGRYAGDRERLRPQVRPKVGQRRHWPPRSTSIRTTPTWSRIIEAWLPLTFAMNSINRSMGLQDLYPFVLTPAVIVKLAFIHGLIACRQARAPRRRRRGRRSGPSSPAFKPQDRVPPA